MKLAHRARFAYSVLSLAAAASLAMPIDAHATDVSGTPSSPAAAVRPIAPASMGIVTNSRPTLRWSNSLAANGARIEICSDRNCAHVISTIESRGTELRPLQDLAPGTYYWRAIAMHDVTCVGVASAVWSFTVRQRSTATDTTIGMRADLDGDGRVDAVHGVTLAGERGRATIELASHREPLAIRAADAGESFGDAAAMAGDIDGDGFGDVVVGAPSFNRDAGRVYVYFGARGGLAPRVQSLDAPHAEGRFGWSVSAAGDVDADGYGDVIVGAYEFAGGEGRAYIYRGTASGLETTPAITLDGDRSLSNFGVSVASAGDIDADGFADVIVGADLANDRVGRAFVYRGSASGLVATAAATLDGFVSRGDFGIAVAGGFDFDADGYGDVAIGAHAHGGTGRAHVFFGSRHGIFANQAVSLVPEHGEREFGVTLAIANDADGDGYDDLRVGLVHGDEWLEGDRLVHGASRPRQLATVSR